jgi:hypothetical protein
VQTLFNIHVKDQKKRNSFKDLCKRARDLNEERNRLVHSYWAVNYDSFEGTEAHRWKDDGKRAGQDAWIKISAAELDKLTQEIWRTGWEMEIDGQSSGTTNSQRSEKENKIPK